MKSWIVRIGLVILGLGAAGLVIGASGFIPVKASSGHWPATRWLLRFAMQRSIATHSIGILPPNLDDPALVLRGAGHYELGCRSCHGSPGTTQPRVAASMLPPPPDLPPRIRASNPQKLFYVVKHGLKFTGMPAWPTQERDDEVWAMVAFLLKLPGLDEAGYRQLVHGDSPSSVSMPVDGPTGKAPSMVVQLCVRCHGPDGLGRDRSDFPRLAGQREEYLANALHAYARGTRQSGTMESIAASLDDSGVQELSRYYASLGGPKTPAPSARETDAEAIARGRSIALDGVFGQRIPACVECHGPGARRGKPAYPALAGQSADYLRLQLQLFKGEQRGGSKYAHLMKPVAARLTDAQVRDVTLYFESLATPGTSAVP